VSDLILDKLILKEAAEGNFSPPPRRRDRIKAVIKCLPVSERRACKVLGQNRSAQLYAARGRDDEGPLTAAIIELASQYGRYGYRHITALLRQDGW